MNSAVQDSDSSDSDLIIVKESKIVIKKNLQHLSTKREVSNSFQPKNNLAIQNAKKKKKNNNDENVKIKKSKKDKVNCVKKCIAKQVAKSNLSSCFSDIIVGSKEELSNNMPQKSKINKMTSSSEIQHYFNNEKVASKKTNVFDENSLKQEKEISKADEDFTSLLQSYHVVTIQNKEIVHNLLKTIIKDELSKQLKIQREFSIAGEVVERLLSLVDCKYLEKFFNLNENTSKLFVRMLCRKKGWHRVTTIHYDDISMDLKDEFELLHKENFVDVNINDQDLKTQMSLLSKPEIQVLCKEFNVSKNLNVLKKDDLIDILILMSSKQKSVLEMLNKKCTIVDLLKLKVVKLLGMCVKLNETVMSTFNKIMLLFSFPHYSEEEEKRFANQLFLCSNVYRNIIIYPDYKLSPTVVFKTLYDFEQYEKSLHLRDLFETAVTLKKHDYFITCGVKAKEEFIRLNNDDDYKKRFMHLESFLKKFSAGTVYAKILTVWCTKFKKKSDTKEIIHILEMLLNQDLFLPSKRGKWYELLSLSYENIKKTYLAAAAIIKSLNDPCVNEVQKLTLQLRGQALLKKKKMTVKSVKPDWRKVLDDLCVISLKEPASLEIKGKVLGLSAPGYKCTYVENTGSLTLYKTVEEHAISYYKSNGFTEGYHAEGFIFQSIYFLLFFNIIYGTSPPGVFQSPYQEAPLDFYSELFYTNRKHEIDSFFTEMWKWSVEEVETKLKAVYYENFNKTCLIKWKEEFTPDIFCEIIKCISIPVLVLICQRFAHNFRLARSGFPDLTLWNTKTKKLKFVEVKSPSDKLSPAQRMWLDYLSNIGVDCEVCNVKNAPGKRF